MDKKYIVHLHYSGSEHEVTVPVYAKSLDEAETLAELEYGFCEGMTISRIRPDIVKAEVSNAD